MYSLFWNLLHHPATRPFIPPDGNSLTLTDVKILQALVFHLDLSLSFLWNDFTYIVCSLPLLFSSLSSLHTSHNSLFQFEWSDFSSLLQQSSNPVTLEREFSISHNLGKLAALLWTKAIALYQKRISCLIISQ